MSTFVVPEKREETTTGILYIIIIIRALYTRKVEPLRDTKMARTITRTQSLTLLCVTFAVAQGMIALAG